MQLGINKFIILNKSQKPTASIYAWSVIYGVQETKIKNHYSGDRYSDSEYRSPEKWKLFPHNGNI